MAPSTVKPPLSKMEGFTTPPSGVPLMGLAEAAKACGVSVSTLRRKRTELVAHGAAQTASGWHIPVTALIAVGLMERVTPPPSPDAPNDGVEGELEALRVKLAHAEQRAAVAESVAAERERVIQTQAMALRMLEASRTPAPAVPDTDAPAPTDGPVTAPSTPDATKDMPSKPVPPGPRWATLRRRLLNW